MDEAMQQAKELAEQSLREQYGEIGEYVGAWDTIDTRRVLGTGGFIFAYNVPHNGKKLIAIGANSREMWLEKIFS